MKFMVDSVVKKNFEIQISMSPVGGGEGRSSPSRKNKFSTGNNRSPLNASRYNTSFVQQTPNKASEQKGGKGKLNASKAEEPYNPFQITDLEMKRIKQTVHLSDESLKKLWEREL